MTDFDFINASVSREVESRARFIAASKMGLVKDPTGSRLPDDLWRQCIKDAEAEITYDEYLDQEFFNRYDA